MLEKLFQVIPVKNSDPIRPQPSFSNGVEDATRGNFGLIGGGAAGTLNVLRRFMDPAPLEVLPVVSPATGWKAS